MKAVVFTFAVDCRLRCHVIKWKEASQVLTEPHVLDFVLAFILIYLHTAAQ